MADMSVARLRVLIRQAAGRVKQAVRAVNRRRLRRRRAARRVEYAHWVTQYDTLRESDRQALRARLARLQEPPLISVLLPTFNPQRKWFEAAVASVRAQLYPHWQLCIADDASTVPWLPARLQELQREDDRIQFVRRERNGHICHASNSALELARGEWVALLDHDDVLAEHALLLVAEAAGHFTDAGLIYSDEDMLGPHGERESPHFKPDWNHDLCLSQNMVCHLMTVRAELLHRVGGFHPGFEGAQDHDLLLRCAERLQPRQIVHIPHVLYHWRIHAQSTAGDSQSKPYATEAGRRAVEEHLHRLHIPARVQALGPGRYRVHWPAPPVWPRVSVLIPTRNEARLLRTCLESLTRLTDYPDYEIIVIDNGSDEADALALLQQWSQHPSVRVLRDDAPFNFSALNNRAAREAGGSVLALLNNDVEITHADWLREMVSQACRAEVGAVGAKLLYPDGTVQHAGVILGIDRGDDCGGVAAHAHRGLGKRARGFGGRAVLAQSFSAVTAACLVVQRQRFEEVGGLDEQNLAVTYNDVDFCLRLREAGYVNVWTPFAELIHHESISRGRDLAPARRERFLRERAYMLQRWSEVLCADPAYNPNLSRVQADFALGTPPTLDWSVPWFDAHAQS